MPDGIIWTECDYDTIEGIDVKAAIKSIVDWLTAIKKSGCKGVTLGLSGGKDSTVVAMLAVKVWGPENVYGVIIWDSQNIDQTEAYHENHQQNVGILCVRYTGCVKLYKRHHQIRCAHVH